MVNFYDPPPGLGSAGIGAVERGFDPLMDPIEAERRRLAALGIGAVSGAAAPPRVADMLAPPANTVNPYGDLGPAFSPDAQRGFAENLAGQLDELGRPRLEFPSRALSALTPQEADDPALAAQADRFVQALLGLQSQPRDERFFTTPPDAAAGQPSVPGRDLQPGERSIGGVVQPDGTILGPDGTLLTPEGAIIRRGATVAATGQVTGATGTRQPFEGVFPTRVPGAIGGGAAAAQPQEERRAIGPGFAGNDALIDAVLAGTAAPQSQTDANPEGITWPILGQLSDPLGRTYTLVQTGAGDYLVWDPRTEQYYPAGDLNEWTTRRRPPAGITAI